MHSDKMGSGGRAKNFQYKEDATDMFALTHLGDLINLPPMETTYRSMSGAEPTCDSPTSDRDDMKQIYVHDDDRVLIKVIHFGHPSSVGIEVEDDGEWQFKPIWAAIVTCGGLCPGLNDVVRQIVLTLEVYGVKDILGLQYGFKGFVDKRYPPIMLTRKIVQRIHMVGGSFLGVSRGCPPLEEIVSKLEVEKRKLKLVVVGIPKTIDNDIQILDKTFGFDTAVEEAQRAINAAYVEVPFELEGDYGVLEFMHHRLKKNGIAVVVIAEGAGQDMMEGVGGTDASGNPILGDIGKFFFDKVKSHFGKLKFPVDVKYIDPTYMIRARPCNSSDHIFCSILGQNAVHGAFAGYTNTTVGVVNTHYCFLPIPEVIRKPRMVDPRSNMYQRCVTSTGQPEFQEPACDKKGSGVGGGWKAGEGLKGIGAPPHPPPDRKRNLNLNLDRVSGGEPKTCDGGKQAPPPSSCGPHSPSSGSHHSPNCASQHQSSSGSQGATRSHGTPSWGGSSGQSSAHEPGCPMSKSKSDSSQSHEPGCPMNKPNSHSSRCHDPFCPIQRH